MRSIEPFVKFNTQIQKIEMDMQLKLAKISQQQRGELAKLVVTQGINSPVLPAGIVRLADDTARQAAGLLADVAPKIEVPIRRLLVAQLAEGELSYVRAGMLINNTENLALAADAWSRNTGGKLLQVLLRLRGDNVATIDGVDGLIGELDPMGVSYPLSPWASATNDIRLWISDELWSETNGALNDAYGDVSEGTQIPWLKQWISAVDERTTATCLALHAVTVPVDDEFDLTGLSPAYADAVDSPPGHWNCRSAMALVQEEKAGDIFSRKMNEARSAEIDRRANLKKGERSRELRDVQTKGRRNYKPGRKATGATPSGWEWWKETSFD